MLEVGSHHKAGLTKKAHPEYRVSQRLYSNGFNSTDMRRMEAGTRSWVYY
jgi:hypothetical protein